MKHKNQWLLIPLLFGLLSASAQNYVTLYTDCNYGGGSQMFKVGTFSLNQSKIGGGTLSSLRIPSGFKVVIYTSADPGNGQKTSFTSDVSCLNSYAWNDRAYSIGVEQIGGNNDNNNNNNNSGSVTLYEDCNYRGYSSTLGLGYHDFNQMGVRNDGLSSIRIPNGFNVTLYVDNNYRGRSTTYSGDISCLSRDWNDKVSSILITRANNNNNNNNNNNSNNSSRVTFFEDCNYRGYSTSLGVGNYDKNYMGVNDDALSSLRVPYGYMVTLYADPNFRGRSTVYTGDISCLSRDFDNKVSSFRITRTNNNNNNNNNNVNQDYVTLFTDDNFGGRSVTLRPGPISSLPTVGFPDNDLSSIQLPSGWKVVIYDQPFFRGSSYTILRTKDRFLLSGWSNKASSMIIYTSGGSN